jgi:hypothetical protein
MGTPRKKRLKTVFKNAESCIDVFASQSQSFGIYKTTSRQGEKITPVYFHDNRLFSYGSHYLLAHIGLDFNGVKIAVVNFSKYSMTTSGQSWIAFNELTRRGFIVVKISSENCGINDQTTDGELFALVSESLKRESERLRQAQTKQFIFDSNSLKNEIRDFSLLLCALNLTKSELWVNIDHLSIRKGAANADLKRKACYEYDDRQRSQATLLECDYGQAKALRRLVV